MARFGDLDTQYFDDAGDPLAYGRVYFYESGTTTPKTTYSDINNSIPNPNPVLLTAAGRQPNIFFDGVARAILTSSSDVQIAVRDPVGETGTNFGDQWVATKIYGATDVVLGSDGIYYRSLINGNQNNNPVTSSGYWTLLYSVEWNAGISYQEGSAVTYNGEQYQSLTNSNLNNNPSTSPASWTLLSFSWISTAEYDDGQNAVGSDGILYTSQQAANTGNDPTDPANRPTYWVGTSSDAAASASAAAASASSAAASSASASTDAATASAAAASASTDAASASADAASAAEDAAEAAIAVISVEQFNDIYLGSKASAPTTDNDGNPLQNGALYFNTTSERLYVYNGSIWVETGSSVNGTSSRQTYIATAAQTTFNITYDIGFVDVYLNGSKLLSGTDFTANSGTDIVLISGASSGDVVDLVAYGSFDIADTYTQSAADAKFAQRGNNLSDLSSLATARSNLGLEIGVNIEAYDATILKSADIGVSVQSYDASTAKYDDATANFTGSLQKSGSDVLVNSDIGSTVQAYDANITTSTNAQTLTNKTLASPTLTDPIFDAGYTENVFALTGTAPALDPSNGTIQTWTLSGNSNPTDSLSSGESITLMINDGTAYTITWPTMQWAGGSAPTLATAGYSVVTLWKVSTTLYGSSLGDMS